VFAENEFCESVKRVKSLSLKFSISRRFASSTTFRQHLPSTKVTTPQQHHLHSTKLEVLSPKMERKHYTSTTTKRLAVYKAYEGAIFMLGNASDERLLELVTNGSIYLDSSQVPDGMSDLLIYLMLKEMRDEVRESSPWRLPWQQKLIGMCREISKCPQT